MKDWLWLRDLQLTLTGVADLSDPIASRGACRSAVIDTDCRKVVPSTKTIAISSMARADQMNGRKNFTPLHRKNIRSGRLQEYFFRVMHVKNDMSYENNGCIAACFPFPPGL
jgi:hypothetical protein